MEQELETTWIRIQEHLHTTVTDSTYHIWLSPLRPAAISGTTLYVSAPEAIRHWIEERYLGLLSNAAQAAGLTTVLIVPAQRDAATGLTPIAKTAADSTHAAHPSKAHTLNPRYTFDRFVIGDSNRFAHAAALASAEAPAEAYNPLYLYGGPGTGKTHLLQAIAWYVGVHGLGLNVLYTTVEAFTSQFVRALQTNTIDSFKSRHRHNDVLLIDDIQFLEHKKQTQAEFFHTIDVLYEGGSQIVLSSDRPPRELGLLETRLRTRFEWGLITALDPPDLETRVTVLKKQVAHDGVEIVDPGVIPLIAQRIEDNLRALEGALIRVVAYASLTGSRIDTALTDRVLSDLYPHNQVNSAPLSVDSIQTAVCKELDVNLEDLVGRKRTMHIVRARHIAIYLARKLTPLSTPKIAREFGGRDHTTVLHATHRITQAVHDDASTAMLISSIEQRLQTTGADPST